MALIADLPAIAEEARGLLDFAWPHGVGLADRLVLLPEEACLSPCRPAARA